MSHSRRQFLVGAAAISLVSALGRHGFAARGKQTRIILLGTKGGPSVGKSGRSNPSTLLLINDVPYVVDCGYGVSRQLIAAGVSLDRLRYIFITHHHSDHNLEFGALFYNAWITGMPVYVDAYGPVGMQGLMQDFFN
jgi:ribonuclease BN (tRNA processing enzyme)